MTINSKIQYNIMPEVNVQTKKNFVFGNVLIKNLNIIDKNIRTEVNVKTVHSKLSEDSKNMTGNTKIGISESKEICLAPPRHGIRNRSCKVDIRPVLFFGETVSPVITLENRPMNTKATFNYSIPLERLIQVHAITATA